MNGAIISVTCAGMSAMVMSQAETMEAATMSMMELAVLAEASRMCGRSLSFMPR